MAFDAGSIVVRLKSDISDFKQGISEAKGMSSSLTDSFKKAEKGSFALLGAVTAVAGAVGLAAKESFGQVRAVENASFALRAYEKDASKVNKVLADLIKFARSDMGVLFQREELFKAASNLRGFGVASDEVVDKVKILARGVSLGMTTFDELSQIIGRVIQKGRLDANEFDMLAQRGIILSSSFRGATTDSAALFKELERVLPAELLKSRANTIDGAFIRLRSAFRDFGAWVLGVDKQTTTFIKGGLGDKFIQAVRKATDLLKQLPSILKENSDKLAPLIGLIVGGLIPALVSLAGAFVGLFAPLIPFMVIGAALGYLAQRLIQSLGGLSGVMSTLSGAVSVLKAVWDFLLPSVTALINTIRSELWPTLQRLWDTIGPGLIPLLKTLAIILGAGIVSAIWVLINALNIGINVLDWIISRFITLYNWLRNLNNIWINVMGAIIYYTTQAFSQVGGWIQATINAFGGIVGAISRAVGGVYDAITRPFRDAFNWVQREVDRLKNKLKDLNPLQRHSPSLVDLVSKGTDALTKQYMGMFDGINQAANRFSAINLAPTLAQPTSVANRVSTSVYGNINIGSQVDADSFMARLTRNQELAQKGLATI